MPIPGFQLLRFVGHSLFGTYRTSSSLSYLSTVNKNLWSKDFSTCFLIDPLAVIVYDCLLDAALSQTLPCGEVTLNNAGDIVTLCGWLTSIR